MSISPTLLLTRLELAAGQQAKMNSNMNRLEAAIQVSVIDRDLTAPPGSPSEGDIYIPTATSTGNWAGKEDTIQAYYNGWETLTPLKGWTVWLQDEDIPIRYTGSSWASWFPIGPVVIAITASTTQTQGQQPLTASLNRIDTCATANDTVTLQSAQVGEMVAVANDGVATLQVFPESGNSIDGGASNASVTIPAGKRRLFIAGSSTDWTSILGA